MLFVFWAGELFFFEGFEEEGQEVKRVMLCTVKEVRSDAPEGKKAHEGFDLKKNLTIEKCEFNLKISRLCEFFT